jgi:hypothetical protein
MHPATNNVIFHLRFLRDFDPAMPVGAAVFLCSDDGSFCNRVVVDGAFLAAGITASFACIEPSRVTISRV